MSKINILSTSKATAKLKQLDTRVIKIRSFDEYESIDFIDFLIDGVSMKYLIEKCDANTPELTTGLQSRFYKPIRIEYIQLLTDKLQPNLASGRVALYICAIDGDPACIAVGCRMEFNDKYVRWYDFAWDNYELDDLPEEVDKEPVDSIEGMSSFIFDRTEYEKLFIELNSVLSRAGYVSPAPTY
jgi:hypothetical protein